MKKDEYSLIDEPWISCIDLNGGLQKYGLLEIFSKAHEIRELVLPIPIVKASVFRLLLAIAECVYAPEDEDDWGERFKRQTFDPTAIQMYLEKFRDRFYLFDKERPFFQASDSRVRSKTLLKMIPHLSSGNNATLFDHSTEKQGIILKPDEAARYLVTLQYYGLGGLSGIPEKFTTAPSCRGISFFAQGDNLFESLMLNLIPVSPDGIQAIPRNHPGKDRPAWEMDNPYEPRSEPYGLLDYLTWQNRRVLLMPDYENGQVVVQKMTEAPGLRMDDNYIDGLKKRDPYQYYREGSQGPVVIRLREDRSVWRDSATLFQFAEKEGDYLPPPNILWLRLLAGRNFIQRNSIYRINALGMASDKAKPLFYGDEILLLPAEYLANPNLVFDLKIALGKAENLSITLYKSVSRMAELIISFEYDREREKPLNKRKKPDKNLVEKMRDHLRADRVFWSGLEPGFYHLMSRLTYEPDGALDDWDELLEKQVKTSIDYSISLAGDDMRSLKAAVSANATVGAGIKKHLTKGGE